MSIYIYDTHCMCVCACVCVCIRLWGLVMTYCLVYIMYVYQNLYIFCSMHTDVSLTYTSRKFLVWCSMHTYICSMQCVYRCAHQANTHTQVCACLHPYIYTHMYIMYTSRPCGPVTRRAICCNRRLSKSRWFRRSVHWGLWRCLPEKWKHLMAWRLLDLYLSYDGSNCGYRSAI